MSACTVVSALRFAVLGALVAIGCAQTGDASPPTDAHALAAATAPRRPSLGPGRLHGRVTAPDGLPARDAVVTILAPMGPYVVEPYSVHTDDDGTFDLGVRPSAAWWLRFESPSAATKCVHADVGDDPVVIALSPSRTIRGRVINSDRSVALAARTVYFDVPGQERRPATIVEHGRFEIPRVGDESGTLVAVIRAHDTISPGSQRVARIERLAPSDDSVELVFGALAISGVLTDDRRRPVRGVGVQAIAEPLSDETTWRSVDHAAASTRDAGEFSIRGLPPGRYALRPRFPGGQGGTGPPRWWDGADEIEAGASGVKIVERIGRPPESK